ncbi:MULTISPECIES: hypothetical protein [Rhizobium]|uniref:Uncharacterized protein n=1 Tax=Rhizobium tropici TaxID=398 RepID=A0A329Y969_RHITR|nr:MULTISPECIES: hypothetical protein [Rhizobium]MBB3286848.1 hypothetical protein [Rhizobium sp. BK252]MBB3401588.1 hypothetical protein [Rhizobium sp. BK289]MBB3414468.1 hypothetical protein [Rhizobium sp. BK284]MBB3482356.1 hypothetical protein [Rhizobium sp. BK347]MDK4718344.1 hypothetical protein [Rhizobium sp. CNPSo 3968]
MTYNHHSHDRSLSMTAISAASRVAIVIIATVGLAPAAFAGQTCAGLKQAINSDGAYLYHYSDRRQPELDLYIRYVSSDSKCDPGEELQSRLVPNLENCYVPTCVLGPGEDDR